MNEGIKASLYIVQYTKENGYKAPTYVVARGLRSAIEVHDRHFPGRSLFSVQDLDVTLVLG